MDEEALPPPAELPELELSRGYGDLSNAEATVETANPVIQDSAAGGKTIDLPEALGPSELSPRAEIISAQDALLDESETPRPRAARRDSKTHRKAALEAYERMKEEQRLKSERGNTTRLASGPISTNDPSYASANLGDGSSDETSHVNMDYATTSSANLDPVVSRQSFANTVASLPNQAPVQAKSGPFARLVRRHSFSIIVVAALLAAGIAYYPAENARSNLSAGEELLAKGDPQGAIDKLTKAIANNPKLTSAYLARATAYTKTGATSLAIEDCSKAIGLEPTSPGAYEQRANNELSLGYFRRAIADFESVSRISGTLSTSALFASGQAYFGDGQYSKALIQFSKKLDRDPGDAKASVAKAKCYMAMNLPNKAIASCSAALSKGGDAYDAYVLRAQCEAQLNDGTAALKDFDKAILLDSQRAEAFISRGAFYAQNGDFTRAVADLDTGVKLPGGIPDARYKRAMVYALQKDKDNALEQFKLIEAKPGFQLNNWFLIQRSDVYAQLQDFKKARTDLETALANDTSYQTACWLRLARCFESEKNYKKAAFFASKVLADEPTNLSALLIHSRYSQLAGNHMTALADLFKAIEVDPKNASAYASRGDLYMFDKQYNLADDDYQKAAQIAPLNAAIKKKLLACNDITRKAKPASLSNSEQSVTLAPALLKEIAEANLETLKQKGYQALKSNHLEYAVAALSRAVHLNQNDGSVRRYLAYAMLKTGNTSEAAQQFYAWEKITTPDPQARIEFVKSLAAQADAQNLFEHLAEEYRINAPVLLEIARQCTFYRYNSVATSTLDLATKVASTDQQVAINRLRSSIEHSSTQSSTAPPTPGAVSGSKPLQTAN
jgi:tetratricopeptide (TPR) repeat protein